MRIITFSGTRRGMTDAQMEVLLGLIKRADPETVRHGMCTGADHQFHNICLKRGGIAIEVYPALMMRGYRARCYGATVVKPAKPPLERNRWMIDGPPRPMALFAAPRTAIEEVRSGTWMTIRYARKQDVPRYVIGPDGEVSYE